MSQVPTTPSQPEPRIGGAPPPQARRDRWTHPLLVAVAPPVVAGIFAVIVVYVGQSQGALPIPSGPSAVAEGTTTAPSASTSPTVSATTASSVPTDRSPAVRHQGEVRLASGGDEIDINAPSSDPTWGVPAGYTESISFSSGSLQLWDLDIVKLGGGEAATYENCSTRTDYAYVNSVDADTLDGLDVCVRSEGGRFAALRLTGYDSDSATLDITTWQIL